MKGKQSRPPAILLATALYRQCLRFYPADFRRQFDQEMTAVFATRLEVAAAQGSFTLLSVCAQEYTSLAVSGVRQSISGVGPKTRLVATGGDGSLLWPGSMASRRPWEQLAGCLGILFLPLLLLVAGWFIYAFFFFTLESPPRVQEVALADFTGNGYLDAYLAIAPDGDPYTHADYLLFNEGNGRFHDSGQDFGRMPTFSVKAADLTGDGRPDLVIARLQPTLYRNSGNGTFARARDFAGSFGGVNRANLAVADLNNDGSLDVFGAGCCGAVASYSATSRHAILPSSRVWLNNGDGRFAASRQPITQVGSHAMALADLNGNGADDAFLAHGTSVNSEGNFQRRLPNSVWLNDGQGNFHDSGQQLGRAQSTAVALGDLNGNGFVDAVVGNTGPDEVWFNDGRGNFSASGQRLGWGLTRALFLFDLNGDGNLDLFVAGETSGRVWLNNGTGRLLPGQAIRYGRYDAVALGDVTGGGQIDIFIAGVASYQVWRGDGAGHFAAGEVAAIFQ
jgi:hypothetical protein